MHSVLKKLPIFWFISGYRCLSEQARLGLRSSRFYQFIPDLIRDPDKTWYKIPCYGTDASQHAVHFYIECCSWLMCAIEGGQLLVDLLWHSSVREGLW